MFTIFLLDFYGLPLNEINRLSKHNSLVLFIKYFAAISENVQNHSCLTFAILQKFVMDKMLNCQVLMWQMINLRISSIILGSPD